MSEHTAAAQITKDQLVLRERRGAVAILRLNRPEARNALSEAMLTALNQALVVFKAHKDVHVIVLGATGPAFCAGHDLKEMRQHRADSDDGRAYYQRIMRQCAELMQSIVRYPKPVIAAVHGPATAAGCQLVASCDLAVAAETATFATPGVNIGLFCSTPMVALSRNIWPKRAMELLLTGDMLPATRAADYGLVNRVVPDDRVLDEALVLANQIAAKSPLTVQIGKEAFYNQLEMPLADAYAYTANVMVENMMTRDAEEGIAAFIDKRTPEWNGQ